MLWCQEQKRGKDANAMKKHQLFFWIGVAFIILISPALTCIVKCLIKTDQNRMSTTSNHLAS